nr:RNA-directed DNA polymerase, eukaryota [Tanacetum cinerariifolium]
MVTVHLGVMDSGFNSMQLEFKGGKPPISFLKVKAGLYCFELFLLRLFLVQFFSYDWQNLVCVPHGGRRLAKWGLLVSAHDEYFRKRGCIEVAQMAPTFFQGKVIWVRAKEVLGWMVDFVEDIEEESDSDDDSYEGEIKSDGLKFSAASDVEGDSDVEAVPESKFKEDPKKHTGDDASVRQNNLEKTRERVDQEVGASVEKQTISNNKGVNDVEESICSGHFKKSEVSRTGGSIIQLMDDLKFIDEFLSLSIQGLAQKAKKDWVKELCVSNKVNFLSLQETKMEKIELFNIKRCWGNFAFEYVYSEDVGNSGGILCVWDPNMFKKINDTVSDYFTMVRGMWVPNGKMLLIISVYAPHELSEKRMLWDYLSLVISNWGGEVVIRGILMKCVTNVRDDFDKLVKDTWKEAQIIESNAFLKMLKKLRYLKDKIQMWSRLNKESSNSRKRKLKAELADLDMAIDKGDG